MAPMYCTQRQKDATRRGQSPPATQHQPSHAVPTVPLTPTRSSTVPPLSFVPIVNPESTTLDVPMANSGPPAAPLNAAPTTGAVPSDILNVPRMSVCPTMVSNSVVSPDTVHFNVSNVSLPNPIIQVESDVPSESVDLKIPNVSSSALTIPLNSGILYDCANSDVFNISSSNAAMLPVNSDSKCDELDVSNASPPNITISSSSADVPSDGADLKVSNISPYNPTIPANTVLSENVDLDAPNELNTTLNIMPSVIPNSKYSDSNVPKCPNGPLPNPTPSPVHSDSNCVDLDIPNASSTDMIDLKVPVAPTPNPTMSSSTPGGPSCNDEIKISNVCLSNTVPLVNSSDSIDVNVPIVPPESNPPPAPLDGSVLQRFDDITKSESDKRQYRALVLSNHMKVMLVSDDTAETTAAALQVNVGHYSDPDELPGLAHFCEHMLFLGTEKYPEENAYDKFFSEHGGWSNACTGTDYTLYYFEVLPPHLGAALDIFAQFFICPLFTPSATERELNAVDSEHQNNVQSDGWRLAKVDSCRAKPGHPYSKFGTGNRQTLEVVPKEKGIDVRQELLKFHQKWYSSNIMALSVFGKESLDDLEAMVVPLFSSVKNSSVEPPSWEHPFPPALRRKYMYCEPVADFRDLTIQFPVEEYGREHSVGRPYRYLSHLIGHEGPGSLLSALKRRGWCNSLRAGKTIEARDFGVFIIWVDLTENGVKNIDGIVALMFQYIAMLRERGPQRDVWEEQADLSELGFIFQDPSEPVSLAKSIVDMLQEFPQLPMEDVLSAWRVTDWKPELIEEALAQLTPENVRVHIVAKCFAQKCTQVEPWYGTKYTEEDIEPDKIKEWQSLPPNPELLMPPPNEFVPSKMELEERTDPTCESIAPEIIKDTPFIRLWFKQDNEFLLPKASIEFELISPLPAQSARNIQLTVLWGMLVEDSLQESTYAAGLARIDWNMHWCLDSICITISGFDDKQHLLLEMILDRIVTYQPDPLRFAVMKERKIRALRNKTTWQPCEHATDELDSCLSEDFRWTDKQRLEAIESLTMDMLVDYMPRFLRSVYVEGIAFGNLTRERALKLAKIVEDRIPKDAVPVLAQELLLSRAVEIEEGSYYLREITNAVHSASCAIVYVECGVYDTRSAIVLDLIASILHEPCMDTLRTKEQLGYIVSGGVRSSCGVQGVKVLVQGDAHPKRLEQRIEAFLLEAQEYLDNMSEEEFVRHRTALAALRAEQPKQIYSKKNEMWSEILTQMYNFERSRIEVEVINTVAKEELIQFYTKHITPSSSIRRKLSVHVVSTAEGGAGYIGDKSDNPDNGDDKHGLCSSDELELSVVIASDDNQDKTDKADNDNDKRCLCSAEDQALSVVMASDDNQDKTDNADNDNDKRCLRSSDDQELSVVLASDDNNEDKTDKADNDNDKHCLRSSDDQELSVVLASDDNNDDKTDNDKGKHSLRSSDDQELSVVSASYENEDSDNPENDIDKHSQCSPDGKKLSVMLGDTENVSDRCDNPDNSKHNLCSQIELSFVVSADARSAGDKTDMPNIDDKHSLGSTDEQKSSTIAVTTKNDSDKCDNPDNEDKQSLRSLNETAFVATGGVSSDGDKDNEKCFLEIEELSKPAVSSSANNDIEQSGSRKDNACSLDRPELTKDTDDNLELSESMLTSDSTQEGKSNVNHSALPDGSEASEPEVCTDDDNFNKSDNADNKPGLLSDLLHYLSFLPGKFCSLLGKKSLVVSDKCDNNYEKQPIKITDLIEFKSRRRLYPRPLAYTTVPQRGS